MGLNNAEPTGGRGTVRDTSDRIKRVLVKSLNLNLSEADLEYGQRLDELVGLDSLAVIEFVTALEKEFGIVMEPEMLRLELVSDLPKLAAYVEDRLARVPRPTA